MISLTTLSCPLWQALNRGVAPSLLARSTWAPRCRRRRTQSCRPIWAEIQSGVAPSLRCWSTRSPGLERSSWRTEVWPFWAARKSAVAPSHMAVLGSAPLWSNVWTAARWPAWAAAIRGVPPSWETGSGWAPAASRRERTWWWPAALARNTAVTPDSFLRSGSAPSSSSTETILSWPALAANISGVVPSWQLNINIFTSTSRPASPCLYSLGGHGQSPELVWDQQHPPPWLCRAANCPAGTLSRHKSSSVENGDNWRDWTNLAGHQDSFPHN